MTALSIVSNVAASIGLSASAVFSSTDPAIIRLRTLMNQEGQELARGASFDHAWTVLTTEKTFTTTAAAIQASSVATDFSWYINNTMWNRTTQQVVRGPMTAEEWQDQQAVSTTGIYPYFRFRGGSLLIYPTPTAGQTVAYEYVSTYWASGSQTAMTADSDTALIEERLIELGLRWRYLKSTGMDYAEDFRTYQMEVGKAIARDGGRKTISLSGPQRSTFPTLVPEGSWTT